MALGRRFGEMCSAGPCRRIRAGFDYVKNTEPRHAHPPFIERTRSGSFLRCFPSRFPYLTAQAHVPSACCLCRRCAGPQCVARGDRCAGPVVVWEIGLATRRYLQVFATFDYADEYDSTSPWRLGFPPGLIAPARLTPQRAEPGTWGAGGAFIWREGGGMFFEQNPILDALWTIGVFVAAWCLATLVMAVLGYCIHNGLWWTEPRLLDLNGNGGRRRRAGR
jgi:hypothetical protein